MTLSSARWSAERANAWQQANAWQCGFNYLPRNAVNFPDMWRADNFSPDLIRQELGWARDCGFNSLRTNLPFVVWQHDGAGLLERMEIFLSIASEQGLSVVFCPLDDCEFSGGDPSAGAPPAPVPGLHNSRAVGSPGRRWVMDRPLHHAVVYYVGALVDHFRSDARVLFWDLYNEPGNRMVFAKDGEHSFSQALEQHSMALMEAAFRRVRDIDPIQPLTVAAWHMPAPWEPTPTPYYQHPLDQAALEWSDLVSFHAYREPEILNRVLEQLAALGRPMICSEWMARHVNSTIENQLELFCRHNVHCYQWGLVRGATQTHLPWPDVVLRQQVPSERSDDTWFHDLLEPDGTPHRSEEIGLIRQCVDDGQQQRC
ncbi:1,4-beta-xylanase [Natronospirillum operosum]|uniref:1,4-beta-xylanase n=1 Tax=Natronospirillum operosum TaxID=2759953 RepID=A0A4Z0WG36_9GAMM|nr:1,4-beta-xylanase [Natronospirillum operosum]TGG93538.1 1,4-beta-xylanase [Natronospirillum operosum]